MHSAIDLDSGGVPTLGSRALFPALQARAYLNHAAISPLSLPVQAAVGRICADYGARGLDALMDWMADRERLRAALAALVGADAPDTIALTGGTTRGLMDLALCVDWRPGDRVLLFQGEFPANITPWQRAADTFDLRVELSPLSGFERPDGGEGLAAVERALAQGGVRLVAVSAVQFQTGLRMPLKALSDRCHAAGALLAVDGIQGIGASPIDVVAEGVDLLSCGAHKWLMGMEGCGFAYASERAIAQLRPRVAGWTSHEDGLAFLFEGAGHLRYDRPIRRTLDFLEVGAAPAPGLAALAASTRLIAQLGVPAIHAHVNRYNDALESGLQARGFRSERARHAAGRSGSLCVCPPDGVPGPALVAALRADGVACTLPDGRVRFAPHWPNALDEVPVVLDAVDRALSRRGPAPG